MATRKKSKSRKTGGTEKKTSHFNEVDTTPGDFSNVIRNAVEAQFKETERLLSVHEKMNDALKFFAAVADAVEITWGKDEERSINPFYEIRILGSLLDEDGKENVAIGSTIHFPLIHLMQKYRDKAKNQAELLEATIKGYRCWVNRADLVAEAE